MKFIYIRQALLCCSLFLSTYLLAQQTTDNLPLKTTDSHDIRIFPSGNQQTQVKIIINKKNPQNLIATCNTYGAGPNQYFGQGYYSTHDGGIHWAGTDYLSNTAGTSIEDHNAPKVAFTTDTIAFMITVDEDYREGYWISKSFNGGISFDSVVKGSNAVYTYYPDIAIDNLQNSSYKNNYYCAWTDARYNTIGFNRSTDKGRTFTNEIYLRPTNTPGYGTGTSVATGPNGEVYICWSDDSTYVSPYAADGCGFTRSLDGGATFSPYKIAFYYAGIRTEYTDPTFNFTRTKDYPSIAADKSNSAHRGRVYIAYPSKQTGKAIIYVRYSDDKGATWSAGKAISIPAASQAFLPAIAVDDVTGNVYVDYYAFDDPNASYSTNTYVAASTNGGNTWTNFKVSDVPHTTEAIKEGRIEEGYYGDYIGITAYNNKVYPSWMDNRTGTWQIYVSKETATVANNNAVAATADIKPSGKILITPNPFTTTLNVLLPAENIKSIQLYNASGTLIKQWNTIPSGTLNVSDVQAGIYTLFVTDKQHTVYTQKLLKQ